MNQKARIKLNLYLSKNLDDLKDNQLRHFADLLAQRLGEAISLLGERNHAVVLLALSVDKDELTDPHYHHQN